MCAHMCRRRQRYASVCGAFVRIVAVHRVQHTSASRGVATCAHTTVIGNRTATHSGQIHWRIDTLTTRAGVYRAHVLVVALEDQLMSAQSRPRVARVCGAAISVVAHGHICKVKTIPRGWIAAVLCARVIVVA